MSLRRFIFTYLQFRAEICTSLLRLITLTGHWYHASRANNMVEVLSVSLYSMIDDTLAPGDICHR